MKNLLIKIIGILVVLFNIGCATKNFIPTENWSVLEGEYYAYSEAKPNQRSVNIASFLKNDYNHFPTSFTIETQNDSLYILYKQVDSSKVTTHKILIEGKRKKKFIKQRLSYTVIPFFPIFARFDIYTLRFGRDKSNNLLISRYYDNSGMILLFGAGSDGSDYYTYKKLEDVKIKRPYFENDKYGILNEQGEKITPPIFSSITNFEDGKADIRIDNNVGIVDEGGNYVIPPLYSSLLLSRNWKYPDVYIASKDGKYGILDKNGKELVPFKYDAIKGGEIFELRLGNKIGLYVPFQVHTPAIYSSTYGFTTDDNFILVFKDDTAYMVNYNGYEYETESIPYNFFKDFFDHSNKERNQIICKNFIYKPNYTKKRKLSVEEEDAE